MSENVNEQDQQTGERNRRKERVGVVVSDKADKTIVVQVERRFAHPLYGKGVARTKRFHAHDEKNEYKVGDTVRIVETRPLSKLKRWRVVGLVDRPV
jgi:small subunit ribosomal protein S17